MRGSRSKPKCESAGSERRLVAALRQRTEAPFWPFFNDLPTNDFNQLFANFYPTGIPALKDDNNFAAAIGSSAFGRAVPAASIHQLKFFR
ncbi:hypothetical protein [Halochromatium roseum]|uniref:hypothetical protein n=1 Tax=Halochromatium roseum TaxID=391920 RepID=UPI003B837267